MLKVHGFNQNVIQYGKFSFLLLEVFRVVCNCIKDSLNV